MRFPKCIVMIERSVSPRMGCRERRLQAVTKEFGEVLSLDVERAAFACGLDRGASRLPDSLACSGEGGVALTKS